MTRRVRRKRRKKIKIFRVIIALIISLALIFGIYKLIGFTKVKIINKDYYLKSKVNEVDTYIYDEENDKMTEGEKLYRGTKVTSHDKIKTLDEEDYVEVFIDDKAYYIKKEFLTLDKDKIIEETNKYVRTSVTVYKNEKDSKIL